MLVAFSKPPEAPFALHLKIPRLESEKSQVFSCYQFRKLIDRTLVSENDYDLLVAWSLIIKGIFIELFEIQIILVGEMHESIAKESCAKPAVY